MLWKLNNPTWNNKGVLENLTISLNHWLVPKKPKPKETFWQRRKKRFQRRFSWTHIKKNWQLFVFMGFIFTVNVILFVTRAVYFRWESLFNNSRERKIGRDLRIDFKADIEKYIQYLLSTLHCGKGILSEFSPLTAEDIHNSHQYLEEMHWFKAIFKMFGVALFEAIEVKGQSMLNFEAATSNFVIISESLAANLEKERQGSVWQTITKFWLICLFYCSSKTYSCR